MEIILPQFSIIGISTITSNKDNASISLIDALWKMFYTKNVSDLISNKVSEDIYAMYTDYASDYKGQYRLIIGHKVNALDTIPSGLIGRTFEGGKYKHFTAKGKMPDAVINMWSEIWEQDEHLVRRYTTDIEVYGIKSKHQDNAEVDIYIGIN